MPSQLACYLMYLNVNYKPQAIFIDQAIELIVLGQVWLQWGSVSILTDTDTACNTSHIEGRTSKLGELIQGELKLGELQLGELKLGKLKLGGLKLGELKLGGLKLGGLKLVSELKLGELKLGELLWYSVALLPKLQLICLLENDR